MECVFKVFIFSAFIAVISTTDYGRNTDVADKIKFQLQSAHTCLETLTLPLTSVIYGSNVSFTQVCSQSLDGKTFFTDCERQFLDTCNARNCDSVNLMPWVQAFPKAAITHLCKLGFNAIDEIQENGGRDCMANVGLDISVPLLNLYGNIWNGQSISCSNASMYMRDVSDQLNSCDKKELRNLIVKYFHEVVNLTPCKGEISPGAAANVATNLLLCVVTIFASLFIAIKRQ